MGKHLVTGAAGFLGRALIDGLLEQGRSVRALDLRTPDRVDAGVEWLAGDVRDHGIVRRACEGAEVVYHLAALIPQRKADAAMMQAVNVEGTQNVLDAALDAGVRRVVFLSSVEIFGVPSVVPCPEDGPLVPLGEYGYNKIEAEARCREAGMRGLEVAVLRPPTIVGPGLDEAFLVGMMGDIRAGRPVMLLGRGENRFQFVHAQDVVSACFLAAEKAGAVGEAFNIGSADVPSIRRMVEEVSLQVGSSSTVRTIPVWLARLVMGALGLVGRAPLEPEHLAIAVADYVFDITKARHMLGWTPRWGNVEAVLDTYRADFQRSQKD